MGEIRVVLSLESFWVLATDSSRYYCLFTWSLSMFTKWYMSVYIFIHGGLSNVSVKPTMAAASDLNHHCHPQVLCPVPGHPPGLQPVHPALQSVFRRHGEQAVC